MDRDVCGRRYCRYCDLHHDAMCEGENKLHLGWCYRHEKFHAPLKAITDLPEEM